LNATNQLGNKIPTFYTIRTFILLFLTQRGGVMMMNEIDRQSFLIG